MCTILLRNVNLTSAVMLSLIMNSNAQSINITGRVIDGMSRPIAGVLASLPSEGLLDTTGNDGIFSLQKAIVGVEHDGRTQWDVSKKYYISHNSLYMLNSISGAVAEIDLYDLTGRIVAQSNYVLSHSLNRLDMTTILAPLRASGLYVLGIAAPDLKTTTRFYLCQDYRPALSHDTYVDRTTGLSKNAAVVDSLFFTKPDYATVKKFIDSYQVTLDSVIMNRVTIYDSNQRIYWLADANLAGNATIRAQLGVTGIDPNGTMDYQTAQDWVKALNAYDNNRGYLGHNNWQLPVTPSEDTTCAVAQGPDSNSFGPSCTNSALGSLYSVFLGHTYPQSVVSNFTNTVAPFHNLQTSLYWSTPDSGVAGQSTTTFSFTLGVAFANTVKYNFMHVLPMRQGVLGATTPTGSGIVVPYSSGSAAGKAVYDTNTHITWVLDANLAASSSFGVSGTTSISSANGVLTVPLINNNGAMLFATAATWLKAMNDGSYAGAVDWEMPKLSDLQTLFGDLLLEAGDTRMTNQGSVGPFANLQPFFYWSCMRDQDGSSQPPCNGKPAGNGPNGGAVMEWAFNFSSGFQGTDRSNKRFYVMVYYPAQ